jgi:hypothetical protein
MSNDYSIETGATTSTLSGVLRLESPEAYERLLAPVRERMRTASDYVIDVSDVVLLNSSGIRALGTLVLAAKQAGIKLTLRGKRDVSWQQKSMRSLAPLYPAGLTVELA